MGNFLSRHEHVGENASKLQGTQTLLYVGLEFDFYQYRDACGIVSNTPHPAKLGSSMVAVFRNCLRFVQCMLLGVFPPRRFLSQADVACTLTRCLHANTGAPS
eukprot:scpid102363/ scgid33819/ 